MSIRISAFSSAIFAVAATCILSMPLNGQQPASKGQERSAQLIAKLQEMREASKKVVSLLENEYKAGNIGFRQLQEARHEVLEIELKLANSSAERMKILSQQLEWPRKAEAFVSTAYKDGSASQIDILQAQIARMEIEIAMLEGVAPVHPGGAPAGPSPVLPRTTNEDAGESDRGAALRDLQFHRTAASLVRLLKLNNDTTSHIEKLGHPTDSAGISEIATIHSAGDSFIAVIARRYPPAVKYPFGEHGIGVGFLFDRDGNLKARFGGALGSDGVNGDEVQFTTLGTSDRWFVCVRRFEKEERYSRRSDIFLVEPTFPLAFRVWSNESVAWTTEPYSSKDFEFSHFFNPGELDLGVKGLGADGKSYHLLIGWDGGKKEFRGPSQIDVNDSDVFAVDLTASKRFSPLDR